MPPLYRPVHPLAPMGGGPSSPAIEPPFRPDPVFEKRYDLTHDKPFLLGWTPSPYNQSWKKDR